MIPISDIIIRSISGYVFIVPALVIYFLLLGKAGKRQRLLHVTAAFVFCYYLFGMLTVTGIGYTKLRGFSPRFALIPFLSMISGPVDTALNVILFIPLGFFLPLLYKKFQNVKSVALTGFLLSVSVELTQMFGWGSTDINDLITNTTGACIGYLIYGLLSRGLKNNTKMKFYSYKVNDLLELLLFIICTFVVMISVQPWVVNELLNIA